MATIKNMERNAKVINIISALSILAVISFFFVSCNKSASNQSTKNLLQHKWMPLSVNVHTNVAADDYLDFKTDEKLYSYNSSNLFNHHYDTAYYYLYDSLLSCADFQIQNIFRIPLNSGIAPQNFGIEFLDNHFLILTYPLPYDTIINGNLTSFAGIVIDSLER
jgi:hypothetical protein